MFNLGGWELILLLVVVVIAAIIFGLRRLWANRASSKTIQDATDPKALEEVDDPPTASASELRSDVSLGQLVGVQAPGSGPSTQLASVQSFITPQHLRALIADRLSTEEMRNLCFDLNADFDSLGGEGRSGKARELVVYFQLRNQLEVLVRKLRDMRPDLGL